MNAQTLVRMTGLMLSVSILAACVPEDIVDGCKRTAIQYGYGKCSVAKGRQNKYGVWVLKLNCSRTTGVCINNPAGSLTVSDWSQSGEFLYGDG